ncbi:MAG: YqhR family membrane protein [Sporolactobacillus sp.]|jgi:hypothetical protein|nr:YqhR family membrane protein [Sporolactobacillus sp.]MCI1882473.1 YqhR family membrane protein [Sporolactobacillus sp.]
MARIVHKKSKKNRRGSGGKSVGRAAVIGLFGGLIWSATGLICHLLNFSSVGPELLFAPFALGKWKTQIGGQLLAVACLSLLSVPLALIYRLTLGRLKFFAVGIGFGCLLWVLVFMLLRRWLPGLPAVFRLGWNTFTTTLCLFVLYGLFIGYSIAFEIAENASGGSYSKK